MDTAQDPFKTADYFFRKADYIKWHRHQSKQQILRSQVGFADVPASRPQPCQGCVHYHGLSYGSTYETRTALICGFHPSGWQASTSCPDWQGSL